MAKREIKDLTLIKEQEKSNTKLENLKHKHKLKEIEAEKNARIEIENLKREHILETMRIRNADIKRCGNA